MITFASYPKVLVWSKRNNGGPNNFTKNERDDFWSNDMRNVIFPL